VLEPLAVPASILAPLPPDPLLFARILAAAGEPFALLHASERSSDPLARFSFVAALPDRSSSRLDPLADDDPEARDSALDPLGDSVLRRAPRWVGVLPYEARRELERPGWAPEDRRPAALLERAEWHRYRASLAIDHDRGEVVSIGLTRADAQELLAIINRGRLSLPATPRPELEIEDAEPLDRHIDRILAAKELILRGDLYQVNLARRIRVALRNGHLTGVYSRLARAAPTPLGALLTGFGDGVTILSTSPELFLLAEPDAARGGFGRLFTAPIKGTRPRGIDARSDEALALELDADPKERAELTMIIDVERNDLGRVAEVGSVRMIRAPHVVTHRTVHHRLALLAARARADLTREDVVFAILPSGSVTGAPKVRAMEVIASLEPRRRGLYTGAFGCVSHDGRLTLTMAIRTLVMRGAEGEYWTGGGIVADSDPDRELEETRWKALQLERAAAGG
jgi:anthranilate/para-aminobenzoate synthase component I